MNIKDPKLIILIGLLLISIGFNMLLWISNRELIEELKQKAAPIPHQKRIII